MKKVFEVIMICLHIMVCVGCNQTSEPINLSDYAGLNIYLLNSQERLHLNELLVSKIPPDRQYIPPGYIWKIQNYEGNERLIVLGYQSPLAIPGTAYISISVFDNRDNYLTSSSFITGNRSDISDIRLKKIDRLISPVICVSVNMQNSKKITDYQYYGLIGDRIALIRIEDYQKQILRMQHSIGPSVPKRTVEEWEKSLCSQDPFEILESLTWLNGIHERISPKIEGTSENNRDIIPFKEVYNSKSIRQSLRILSDSDTEWIREAANLAYEGFLPKRRKRI